MVGRLRGPPVKLALDLGLLRVQSALLGLLESRYRGLGDAGLTFADVVLGGGGDVLEGGGGFWVGGEALVEARGFVLGGGGVVDVDIEVDIDVHVDVHVLVGGGGLGEEVVGAELVVDADADVHVALALLAGL